jgi:hypothetical protein
MEPAGVGWSARQTSWGESLIDALPAMFPLSAG